MIKRIEVLLYVLIYVEEVNINIRMKESTDSRRYLFVYQKLKIIAQLEKGTCASRLAEMYNVSRSAISQIKKQKDKYLKAIEENQIPPKKRKILKRCLNEQLENEVFKWFSECRERNEPVSGPMLCKKAVQIYQNITGKDDFKGSRGWLYNFKKRHNLTYQEMQGEKLHENVDAAIDFCFKFQNMIMDEKKYDLDFTFNVDEIDLLWKSLPMKSEEKIPEGG